MPSRAALSPQVRKTGCLLHFQPERKSREPEQMGPEGGCWEGPPHCHCVPPCVLCSLFPSCATGASTSCDFLPAPPALDRAGRTKPIVRYLQLSLQIGVPVLFPQPNPSLCSLPHPGPHVRLPAVTSRGSLTWLLSCCCRFSWGQNVSICGFYTSVTRNAVLAARSLNKRAEPHKAIITAGTCRDEASQAYPPNFLSY